MDDRLERSKRHVHIRRIRCNAVITGSKDRQHAVVALQRIAAGPGLTLVTIHRNIAKIDTAGSLHQVAADGGGVAQLRRGPCQQSLREHGVLRLHHRVVRQHRIAYQGANL